jgi:hypothetical protein
MAFTLNPGSTAPQAGGGISAPVTPGSPAPAGAPSVPDSPFLFMRYRDQEEKPINMYIQIVLMAAAVLSIIICVVLLGYSMYLKQDNESKDTQIKAMDANFKEYPFDDMRDLSYRMSMLKTLLNNYVAVASPLLFLEKVVEKQVIFDNFTFLKVDGQYTISFTAVTNNYRALIQQLGALNLTEYHKVAPTPKPGMFVDNVNTIKVQVTTPVLVQGKLPGDVESLFVVDAPQLTTPAATSTGTAH